MFHKTTMTFPEEIPLRCIKLYSFVGDLVLDPFGGSGTTGIVAMKLKRNSVMYEINEDYSKMIMDNFENEKGLLISDTITLEK